MWVVGLVWAGCVTLAKLLSFSGPQHPLLNEKGLNLVSFHLLDGSTSCKSLSL